MRDERVEAYARLLVERSIDAQRGWQVLVESTPLARPLNEALARALARRGAYGLMRVDYPATRLAWAREAPLEILEAEAPIERHLHERIDAYIFVGAPENTREAADLAPERNARLARARQPFLERCLALGMPWVYCRYPTPALAQDAGMTLEAYEAFLYDACLLDWDEEGRRMRRIADRFDRADRVRVEGPGTDIAFSLRGRRGHVDDGHLNMPGGEVYYSPVEDSADGVVAFSEFPAFWRQQEAEGVRLAFREGRVVEASARHGEELLRRALETDAGAPVLGEFGIGCNPRIQRYTRETLFSEKMDGTVHLAIGAGFRWLGGTNASAVHWDMVKDLRRGGRITCDGEVVQEDGRWLI